MLKTMSQLLIPVWKYKSLVMDMHSLSGPPLTESRGIEPELLPELPDSPWMEKEIDPWMETAGTPELQKALR